MEFHPHSVLMDSDMEGPGRRVHLQAFQRPQGEERGGEHIELSDAQIAILPHSVVIGCQGRQNIFPPCVQTLPFIHQINLRLRLLAASVIAQQTHC